MKVDASLEKQVIIEDIPIKMLIDSGATSSLLHQQVYEAIPIQVRPKLKAIDIQITLADGSIQPCQGKISLPLQIGPTQYSVEFLVGNWSDEAILGMEELKKNEYDIVLCDIEMPVLDGFGVIQAVRAQERWKDLPVIALTSLNEEDTINRGLELGFNDWMVKLDKQKILACINSYLN